MPKKETQVKSKAADLRKQAKQKLKESEDFFRILFHKHNAIMLLIEQDTGRILDANESALKYYGYSAKQLCRMTIQQINIMPAEEVAKQMKLATDLSRNFFTFSHRLSNGKIRNVEVHSSPIKVADKNILFSIVNDITDRIGAEDELRAKEERFAMFLRHSPVAIYIKDADTRAIALSHHFEKTLGQPLSQLLGKSNEELWPSELAAAMSEDDKKVLKEGSIIEREETFEGRYYRSIKFPITTPNGLSTLGGFSIDITERKRMVKSLQEAHDTLEQKVVERTEQLQKSEEKYHLLFNSGKDFVAVHLIGKDGQLMNFIEVNDAACTILGYTREEFLKLSPRDVDSVDRSGQMLAFLENLIEDKHVLLETEMISNNGHRIPMEVSITLFQLGDNQAALCVARDITGRKQIESQRTAALDALQTSEANYKQLFDNSPVAIYQMDYRTGKFANANDVMCQYLGCSREEIAAHSPFDILTDESKQLFLERLKKIGLGEKVATNPEFEIVDKKGERIAVQLNTKYIYNSEGLVIAADVVAHDITERKRAEDLLWESRQRFQGLIETLYDWIWEVDPQGHYTYISSRIKDILGYEPADLLGKTPFELMPMEEAERVLDIFMPLVAERKPIINLENINLHKDGHPLVMETSGLPFYDSKGEYKGYRGTDRDITAKVAVSNLLQKEQQRLADIIEGTNSGTWDWNMQSGETHINKRWAEIIGYTLEELSPLDIQAWRVLIHPDDQKESNAKLKRHFSGADDYYDFEFRMRHKNGSWVWIHDRGRIVEWNANGKPLRMSGIHMDVTERKKAEEQLLATNRQMETAMELANEMALKAEAGTIAKSRFLANMSHEIRTPLSGLIGMTGLLLETALTDKQRDYTEKINTSGESLLTILNNVLDYSKIEVGRVSFENIPFSLKEVIGNVVNIFELWAKGKGISLVSAIDPELPTAVLGSPQHLNQIISNLIGNAVKFTEEGEVEVAVRVKQKSGANVELEISVRDTGIGMSKKSLSKLFQAFNQADTSTTRRFGGTGLGLAISKQLVEFMGGTIRVESIPGKGSVFTVALTLPIATEAVMADFPISSGMPRARFTGVRALIAEDHEINREIIVELLWQAGIEADIAKNGSEAVEMVKAQEYDILFMDIEMPELDGYAATWEIRKLGRKGVDRLPILAMTAHGLAGDREQSLAAGMNDHLTKPINPDVLNAALRQWLPKEKYDATVSNESELIIKSELISTAQMPGLDVEGGLHRLGGNSELYMKLLRDFIEGYGEAPEQLLQDLRMEHRDEAVRHVHAIRGVAGNLGGNELAAAAMVLERALQTAGNGVPFSLGKPLRLFTDRHEALMTAIGNVLARYPTVLPVKPQGSPGDVARLRSELERLKIYLKNKEPLPCHEILGTLLKSRWSESHEVVLAELSSMMQNYRMVDALAYLEKVEYPITNGENSTGGSPLLKGD